MSEKYYFAYDKRYKQVHSKNLSWATSQHSPIVIETLEKYFDGQSPKILDVGCGEGRDVLFLLKSGYDVKGIDVSVEAINYCKSKVDDTDRNRFQVLDVCTQNMEESFDFIYSVATLHMLVNDTDRQNYLAFIYRHLSQNGYALILTMGDGINEMQSDTSSAFENQKRIHRQTNTELELAATSCRMVSFPTLEKELTAAGFSLVDKGITCIDVDFPTIMFAVVKK